MYTTDSAVLKRTTPPITLYDLICFGKSQLEDINLDFAGKKNTLQDMKFGGRRELAWIYTKRRTHEERNYNLIKTSHAS